MTKKRVITLKDVAERVGVSRMTVSLALRDDGRIPEATRERVHSAASELGYTPNPRISELMAETARSRYGVSGETLAFVTSEPTRDGWKKFSKNIFTAMDQRASDFGYCLEPWWIADPDLSPSRTNQILWSRGVRGLIIANISRHFFERWNGTLPIEWERFSVVEIGGSLRHPHVNQVQHDHQAGLFMAIDQLEAMGYRRIGLCLKSEDDLRTHHRWAGAYLVWRALRGYAPSVQPLIVEELTPDLILPWVRDNQLEAVISPGVLPLKKWGLKVPAKLGFASLDLWGEGAEGLSGIDQDSTEIAVAAVDMLATLLRRNQRGVPDHPMRWLIGGRWVAGESTLQIRDVDRPEPEIEDERLSTGKGI